MQIQASCAVRGFGFGCGVMATSMLDPPPCLPNLPPPPQSALPSAFPLPRTSPAAAKLSWRRSGALGTYAGAMALIQVPVLALRQKRWLEHALWQMCDSAQLAQEV